MNADKKATEKNLVLKLVYSLKLILVISFFELMELKYFNLSLEKRQFADSVLFFYALPSKKRENIYPLSGIIKIIILMIKIAKKLKV